jgi:hypothetical protein
MSQVNFDEQRRISASGVGATAFFAAKAAKKGKRSHGRSKKGPKVTELNRKM